MENLIKITKKVLIMMFFTSLLVYCQSSSNKEVKVDKNENFDLSGIYLKKSGDTLKYQLSLLKIDSIAYYYELFDYKDSTIYGNSTKGVFKKIIEKKDSIYYCTIYTTSSNNGFTLSLFNNNDVRLDIDRSSGDAFINTVGIYVKYDPNKDNVISEKIGDSTPKYDKGTYYQCESIVSNKEIYFYKYPYPSQQPIKVRLSLSDELRIYYIMYNYEPSGTLNNFYYVALKHKGEWIKGWINGEGTPYFKRIVRYMDGEKHEYER